MSTIKCSYEGVVSHHIIKILFCFYFSRLPDPSCLVLAGHIIIRNTSKQSLRYHYLFLIHFNLEYLRSEPPTAEQSQHNFTICHDAAMWWEMDRCVASTSTLIWIQFMVLTCCNVGVRIISLVTMYMVRAILML